MSVEKPLFLVLSPVLQTYAWGKKGSKSEACNLKASGDRNFVLDENQTYAEVYVPRKSTYVGYVSNVWST